MIKANSQSENPSHLHPAHYPFSREPIWPYSNGGHSGYQKCMFRALFHQSWQRTLVPIVVSPPPCSIFQKTHNSLSCSSERSECCYVQVDNSILRPYSPSKCYNRLPARNISASHEKLIPGPRLLIVLHSLHAIKIARSPSVGMVNISLSRLA